MSEVRTQLTYNLNLDAATTPLFDRLFEAAKWCSNNNLRPKPIQITEGLYKKFYSHPQFYNRLYINKCFPPAIEVFGFLFQVDLSLSEKEVYSVPLLDGYVTIQDALVFDFVGSRND